MKILQYFSWFLSIMSYKTNHPFRCSPLSKYLTKEMHHSSQFQIIFLELYFEEDVASMALWHKYSHINGSFRKQSYSGVPNKQKCAFIFLPERSRPCCALLFLNNYEQYYLSYTVRLFIFGKISCPEHLFHTVRLLHSSEQ